MSETVTEESVKQALRQVYDPEISINVQDLGLIYDIQIKNNSVHVVHTLTSPMCPFADYICNSIIQAVKDIPGVTDVSSEVTFDPPFTLEMVPEATRLEHGLL